MKKRVGGLPNIPQGPKVKTRKFDLKRSALMTNTIRAQNLDKHKKHAEANAHRVAVIRAQNRNTLMNEYNNLFAASVHGSLRGFAVQRMADLKSFLN
ncbi:hypothetical protein N9L68_01005 [bacterium]|nr:hypothetical protein [bacterium]